MNGIHILHALKEPVLPHLIVNIFQRFFQFFFGKPILPLAV